MNYKILLAMFLLGNLTTSIANEINCAVVDPESINIDFNCAIYNSTPYKAKLIFDSSFYDETQQLTWDLGSAQVIQNSLDKNKCSTVNNKMDVDVACVKLRDDSYSAFLTAQQYEDGSVYWELLSEVKPITDFDCSKIPIPGAGAGAYLQPKVWKFTEFYEEAVQQASVYNFLKHEGNSSLGFENQSQNIHRFVADYPDKYSIEKIAGCKDKAVITVYSEDKESWKNGYLFLDDQYIGKVPEKSFFAGSEGCGLPNGGKSITTVVDPGSYTIKAEGFESNHCTSYFNRSNIFCGHTDLTDPFDTWQKNINVKAGSCTLVRIPSAQVSAPVHNYPLPFEGTSQVDITATALWGNKNTVNCSIQQDWEFTVNETSINGTSSGTSLDNNSSGLERCFKNSSSLVLPIEKVSDSQAIVSRCSDSMILNFSHTEMNVAPFECTRTVSLSYGDAKITYKYSNFQFNIKN